MPALRGPGLSGLQADRLEGNSRLRNGAPNVLTNSGVDAERYSGWAFGMGPGRVAMNRFGLPDIRYLYSGDMRLLRQFGGTDR